MKFVMGAGCIMLIIRLSIFWYNLINIISLIFTPLPEGELS